jgi:hypothetical protein
MSPNDREDSTMTQPTYPPPPPHSSPPPGVAPTRAKRWPWIVGVVVAFILGIAVGAASADNMDDATTASDRSTGTPTGPVPEDPEPVIEETATPEPDVEFQFSCDYVLGDFTENPDSGYRFIADANLNNVGNVGAVTKVTATWYLSGGDKVTKSKTVKIAYGVADKRIGFSVPATQDEIDRHQSATGETCKIGATVTDTYGAAH